MALVIASSRAIAEKAAKLVTADYSGSSRPLLDFDDAIEASSWLHPLGVHEYKDWKHGDADAALKDADVVFEGTSDCGHQYHFYMETQAACASPSNGGLIALLLYFNSNMLNA